jgi:hypothetical protein
MKYIRYLDNIIELLKQSHRCGKPRGKPYEKQSTFMVDEFHIELEGKHDCQ